MKFTSDVEVEMLSSGVDEDTFVEIIERLDREGIASFPSGVTKAVYGRHMHKFKHCVFTFKIKAPRFLAQSILSEGGVFLEIQDPSEEEPCFFIPSTEDIEDLNDDRGSDNKLILDMAIRGERTASASSWNAYKIREGTGMSKYYSQVVLPGSYYSTYLWTVDLPTLIQIVVEANRFDARALNKRLLTQIWNLMKASHPKILHAFEIHPFSSNRK